MPPYYTASPCRPRPFITPPYTWWPCVYAVNCAKPRPFITPPYTPTQTSFMTKNTPRNCGVPTAQSVLYPLHNEKHEPAFLYYRILYVCITCAPAVPLFTEDTSLIRPPLCRLRTLRLLIRGKYGFNTAPAAACAVATPRIH